MHLVISTEKGDIVNIEVDSSEVIENVKAIIEVETSIPLSEQVVFYNGKELTNAQTLVQAQIQENELLFVQRRPPFDPNNPLSNPTAFRDYVRSQPHLIQQVLQNDPELGETILGDDINKLVNILKARDALRKKQQQEQLQKMRMLESDPFNPEAQKLIAEEIRLENVRENMENAIEHIPESFGRVTMLYIDCDVNNTNLKAFVDSGAQQTIMSVECAERCNIMRLIDTRFSGIAKGVGQARILGRVHAAPLKIGKAFFPCSFTILEGQGVDFLLGLDMLKRYQCTLDLHNNVLKIGDESVPFLAEKDIPRSELFDDLSSSSSSDITTSTPNTNPKNNNNNSSSNNSSKLSMTSAQFSDEVVENIMKLGFSKEEVINALRMFNGNPEQAASYLFGGGF